MPPPSPDERLHPSSSSHYTSARRPMYAAAATTAAAASSPTTATRQSQYSSLEDALGGRAVSSSRHPHAPPTNVSVSVGYPQMGSEGRPYYPPPSAAAEALPYDYSYAQQQPGPSGPEGAGSTPTSYEPSAHPPFGAHAHPSSLPPMRSVSPSVQTASASTANPYTPVIPSYPPGPGSHQQSQQHQQHTHSQAPPQAYAWTDEDWGQAPFTPDTVQHMMTAGRSDVVGSPPAPDSRAAPFAPPLQYPSASINIRPDARPAHASEVSPGSKGKGREHEGSYRSPSMPFSPGHTDYGKLVSTYGQLFSQCDHLIHQESLAEIDDMMRIAQFGLTLFPPYSTSSAPPPPVRKVSIESSSNGAEQESASPDAPVPKRPTDPTTPSTPASDGQKCLGCGATATPEWRRGPLGPRTLCNACGLVYAKMIKKRGRDAARVPEGPTGATTSGAVSQRAPVPSHAPVIDAPTFATLNDPESDDELSYGSQEPA